MYKQSTQVPNILFDALLKSLTFSELKVLLVVVRQTNGWVDRRNGGRKKRARITHSFFMEITGLSRRAVGSAVQSLESKRYVAVTNYGGIQLSADMRRGRDLYYRCLLNPWQQRSVGQVRRLSELLK